MMTEMVRASAIISQVKNTVNKINYWQNQKIELDKNRFCCISVSHSHLKLNKSCTSASLWSRVSVSLSHLLLCLTVWHTCASTSIPWKGALMQMQAVPFPPPPTHTVRHTCPIGLRSLATVMSIFSNTVQTGEKPWPSTLLSEPVHHCHSGSLVQNSSFLSCWSPPDWTRLVYSPPYRCQESQLTACCCSWFQFVGPAMG